MLTNMILSTVMRCLLMVSLCSSMAFAADASAPISPEEAAFIEKSLSPLEQMEMTTAIRTEAFPPVKNDTPASRTQAALLRYKAILAARGVVFKPEPASAPPAAQAAATDKTPYQLDVEFLQANLKPEEWQQLLGAYRMAQSTGDNANYLGMMQMYKGRLAARGVKPAGAAVPASVKYEPKSEKAKLTYTDQGEISVVMVLPTGHEFKLPRRDKTVPAEAKQSVTWIDPGDESKGVKAAGFLAADGSKHGLWIEWNAAWKRVSGGTYAAGQQTGEWVEYEYAANPAVETAKHTGSYANGLRTGVWKTEYTGDHAVVIEAKKKLGPNADGTITQSLNEINGYHQTDTYVDGKAVKTERDF